MRHARGKFIATLCNVLRCDLDRVYGSIGHGQPVESMILGTHLKAPPTKVLYDRIKLVK